MYIDKLYNKLFSAGDIQGIETLMNEIRSFSTVDDKKGVAKQKADQVIKIRGIKCPKTKQKIRKQLEANVLGNRN